MQTQLLRSPGALGRLTVPIASGVTVTLPFGRDAAALALAELHQAAGDIDAAIDVVEEVDPTTPAAVSLAELYSEAGRRSDVIVVTEGLANVDDATALLLVFRSVAYVSWADQPRRSRRCRRRFAPRLQSSYPSKGAG